MNEPKSPIRVTAEVDSFEKVKELLADLEVLNEKYDVSFDISYALFQSNYIQPEK
ncbi:hypothetical protein [Enterococcus sp. LJL90]